MRPQTAPASRPPSPADARGPLDAWQQFTNGLKLGDKAGAMNQLTPPARDRYGPVFDALIGNGKSK